MYSQGTISNPNSDSFLSVHKHRGLLKLDKIMCSGLILTKLHFMKYEKHTQCGGTNLCLKILFNNEHWSSALLLRLKLYITQKKCQLRQF